MKTVLMTAALLLVGTFACVPTASAAYCDFPEVTVDEVQACGNETIDYGQYLSEWAYQTACDITCR